LRGEFADHGPSRRADRPRDRPLSAQALGGSVAQGANECRARTLRDSSLQRGAPRFLRREDVIGMTAAGGQASQ